MKGPRPGEAALIDLLASEARGPRRHALYAAWLFTRVCLDMAGPVSFAERNTRRRLTALRKRLGSLTLPVAFRRALHDIIEELGAGSSEAATIALEELSRSVRDTLGEGPAAAVGAALEWVRTGDDETGANRGRTERA